MATLLSLLAAAIRKGQQQCYLPPGICVTLGQVHQCFPGPGVPATPRAQASQPAASQNAVPDSIPTTIPGFPGAAGSRLDAGVSSFGAVDFAHDPSGHHVAAHQLLQLQWQNGVNERRRAQCVQVVSHQQLCTQSILDIPNAQSTPTQSASPGTARSWSHLQLLPCLTSCGPV